MAETETHDTLLGELRRLNLYPPEERQLAELRFKLDIKFSGTQAPQSGLESAKYAIFIYGLGLKAIELEAEQGGRTTHIAEDDDTTADICLDNLALMGPCGRNLAAQLLCNRLLPFSRVKAWFSRQPDKTAIAVADRMLAVHHGEVPERIKFAESVLELAGDMDISECVDFFNENGTRKGQLTFSSLARFLIGNYGKECREKLFSPQDLNDINVCVDSLPPYPDSGLVDDVSFHLKTMDPIIMEKVLRTVDRLADEIDDELLKEILPLAKSPSLPLAKAAMDVLARFGGSRRGRIFTQVFNEAPRLRAELINRLPLLSGENLSRFMSDISDVFHTPVLAVLFATISEEDPQCFAGILSNVLKESRSNKKSSLKPVLARIMETDSLAEPGRPEMPEGKNAPGIDFIKQGGPIVLNIEQKEVEQTGFKRIFGKQTVQSDGMADIFSDGQITNQRLHKLNKWKSLSHGLAFQNSVFSACEFKDSFFEECSFKKCTFEGCTFSDTIFLESKFKDCNFNSCSLDESTFYDCTLEHCSFKNSQLDSAVFFLSHLKKSKLTAVAVPGVYFCRTRFTQSTFHVCDLREAFFYKGQIKGCDFSLCDFETALFRDSGVNGSHFIQCNMSSCRAMNVRTEIPQLLKAMERTFAAKLAEREKQKKRSAGFGDINEYGRGVLYKTIKRWFAFKDIERCHTLFARNNSRRINWTESKLNNNSRKLFKILPALLHTNVFELKTGMEQSTPGARIKGYELSPQHIELLDELFPDIKYEAGAESAIPIEAFMSIGSTGTIAQTPDSDLDLWVCCDFKGIAAESRIELHTKLQAIEKWAMQEFNLEIHFFIMDTRDIRNNRFGLSDEESSGSAQSAILKEEFYRTALLLAGKPPLWWFSPPEASEKAYANSKKRLDLLKGKDYYTDLGNIPNIPVEEFFGASLWQIVKGVKSPFKSIMKLGLLELYTSDNRYSLLCEKLKANIVSGKRRIRRVDPYMRLYRDLADFYRSRDHDDYIWLTAMALRLKCGLVGEKGIRHAPFRPEEIELMEFALNLSGDEASGAFAGFKDLSDFRSVVELGRRINQFMVNTYIKIRGEQDKIPGVAITPEDLTRLGRIIFSTFAKRTNKILRLSLPGPRTHFFKTINISRSESDKNWIIQGEYPDESGARNILTPIESGPDLNFMLVWLALNGLYSKNMQIKTDISSGPLREREIAKLFTELMNFFPPKETFNVPIEETLNAERLEKGFFIVNLCVPPESQKVQEAHFVYRTNWGEVFCKPLKVNVKLVETPEEYLKGELGSLCDGDFRLGQFVPHNSECPFLKIPVV